MTEEQLLKKYGINPKTAREYKKLYQCYEKIMACITPEEEKQFSELYSSKIQRNKKKAISFELTRLLSEQEPIVIRDTVQKAIKEPESAREIIEKVVGDKQEIKITVTLPKIK